jgi:hypothetical protein
MLPSFPKVARSIPARPIRSDRPSGRFVTFLILHPAASALLHLNPHHLKLVQLALDQPHLPRLSVWDRWDDFGPVTSG